MQNTIYRNQKQFYTQIMTLLKIKKIILMILFKKKQNPRNKLNQEDTRSVHTENYKTLKKKLEDINGEVFCVHELQELMLLKCPYYLLQ
jgi:hypothetical protein